MTRTKMSDSTHDVRTKPHSDRIYGQLQDICTGVYAPERINEEYTPQRIRDSRIANGTNSGTAQSGHGTGHAKAEKHIEPVDLSAKIDHMEAVKMNPKHIRAQKDGKAPMEYLVWPVLEGDAHVHKGGADKYGVRNWRVDKILASTYEGAIMRHFTAWAGGQNLDPDSGFSHLYHIRCCCAILLDSEQRGTLIDDRDRVDSINERSE